MAHDVDSTAEKIDRARKLLTAGAFVEALGVCQSILDQSPEHRDALYMAVVSARYQKDFPKARGFLERLIALAPDFGRAYQEEAHLFKAEKNFTAALSSYRRACHFNPALSASWRALGEILVQSGQPGEAAKLVAQADYLEALPREILAAMNHVHEGRLVQGEQCCRAFLRDNPKNVDAMRVLADIGARLNILDEAEFLLESAVVFAPDNSSVRLEYIEVLRKRQKYREALEHAQCLYEKNPNDPVFQSHLAIENMHNNDFERAFLLFDEVLKKLPGDPATLTSKAHALKTYGQRDEAIATYRRAYSSMPDYGEAWFGLANLKTYRFTDEEIDQMRTQEKLPHLSHMARVQICFSLGKALEDRGDFEQAFHYYETGNNLKRIQSRYDADEMTADLHAQIEHGTAALFEQSKANGCPAPDPIFVLGLPRAGSTLLEQILASHSQVDGTLELPNILSLAHGLRRMGRARHGSPYPQNLHELSAEQLRDLGEKYITGTKMHRAGAPFFIDKMPNNFRHIALIRLILPNAKIIDARRAPLSCCFSGFKQLFAEGQEFTYGLEQIGQYYRDYVDVMHHWDDVLPGKILRVHYENVVADLETQVRRILDYCGLEFEPACVEFYKTDRAVRTASSEQVRQPINTKGLEPWVPFEAYLDPLKSALGPALTEYKN